MTRRRIGSRGLWGLAVLAVLGAGCSAPDDGYRQEIDRQRAEREERLRAEDGWLSLVGLFWLEPGENRFGADPRGPIVLAGEGVPGWAGTLHYDGATARLEPAPGVPLTVAGEPAEIRTLADDADGAPDVVRFDVVSLYVIRRGGTHAVRVKDPRSEVRTSFRGIDYFPVDPAYRVRGKFHAYDEPREIAISTVTGYEERMVEPGWVDLRVGGKEIRLHPMRSEGESAELFFMFRDLTSGNDTYGAGRYIDATLDGDEVEVDFNRAYNPPCAFTPYATCPLPPRSNWLDVRIEAGEKKYGSH